MFLSWLAGLHAIFMCNALVNHIKDGMQAPVMGGMAGPDSQTLGAGDLHTAKSRLGLAYEALPKGLQQTSLLGGSRKTATLTEVEVYFAPEIAALY